MMADPIVEQKIPSNDCYMTIHRAAIWEVSVSSSLERVVFRTGRVACHWHCLLTGQGWTGLFYVIKLGNILVILAEKHRYQSFWSERRTHPEGGERPRRSEKPQNFLWRSKRTLKTLLKIFCDNTRYNRYANNSIEQQQIRETTASLKSARNISDTQGRPTNQNHRIRH